MITSPMIIQDADLQPRVRELSTRYTEAVSSGPEALAATLSAPEAEIWAAQEMLMVEGEPLA